MANDTVDTLSANGQSVEVDVRGPAYFSASGDFGGGTVVLQRKASDGAWRDISLTSLTEAGDKLVDFPPRAENTLRASLSGSSSPDLDVIIQSSSYRY
jgi:hypothetical protein